jgi:hypothetical protein
MRVLNAIPNEGIYSPNEGIYSQNMAYFHAIRNKKIRTFFAGTQLVRFSVPRNSTQPHAIGTQLDSQLAFTELTQSTQSVPKDRCGGVSCATGCGVAWHDSYIPSTKEATP